MRRSKSGKLGFTLIELLVVIAIIAILAAILFPVLSNAKERANQTSCIDNIKQLSNAVFMYADDNNGYAPYTTPSGYNPNNTPAWCGIATAFYNPEGAKTGSIYKYTHTTRVYKCPTLSAKSINNRNKCTVYSMNQYLSHAILAIATSGRATKFMMFMEEDGSNGGGNNDGNCAFDDSSDKPSIIHYNGCNIGYADGHSRFRTQRQALDEGYDRRLKNTNGLPLSLWYPPDKIK